MVDIHMFLFGPTSFIYTGWPGSGFLHCLMDPSLAHLGRHSPLVNSSSKVGVGHFRIDPSFLPLPGSSYSGSGN